MTDENRNETGHLFSRIKGFRRFFSRFDKLSTTCIFLKNAATQFYIGINYLETAFKEFIYYFSVA